jgi:hypothetical protein
MTNIYSAAKGSRKIRPPRQFSVADSRVAVGDRLRSRIFSNFPSSPSPGGAEFTQNPVLQDVHESMNGMFPEEQVVDSYLRH